MSAPVSLRLSPSPKLVPSKAPPSMAAHSHAHALVAGLGEPLVTGNRVDLLQDGPGTYAAMFEAIDNARDHVNLESYILEAEGPGEEFARRLIARAKAGVRVNVLYDSFGSIGTPASYFDHLRANGVNVCEYNPLRRLGNLLSRALHLRDHRKLMVVDGRIGFIGGVNISSVYSAGSSPLAALAGSEAPAHGATASSRPSRAGATRTCASRARSSRSCSACSCGTGASTRRSRCAARTTSRRSRRRARSASRSPRATPGGAATRSTARCCRRSTPRSTASTSPPPTWCRRAA